MEQTPELTLKFSSPRGPSPLDAALSRYRALNSSGQRPMIEDFLKGADGPDRSALLRGLLAIELAARREREERAALDEYRLRFPADRALVEAIFRETVATKPPVSPRPSPGSPDEATLAGDPTADFRVAQPGHAGDATLAGVPTAEFRGGEQAAEFQATMVSSDGGSGPSTPSGSQPPGAPSRGSRVFGDYVLLDRLGGGGMGVVHRAHQRSADRIVALKLIKPDLLDGRSEEDANRFIERFRTEAQTTARLVHDHIVTVHDVGQIDGQPFYSMRYVEGRSLSQILRDGPLPSGAAAALLKPIALAVHHAHVGGIVHRDLKPSNILVDAAGRPYVTDFGLAKWLATDSRVTVSGERLGTPAYMSPEQARGSLDVGVASDVYSLGATLYEAVTGRPPFQAADQLETLRQVIDQEPVPPRRLNGAVDRDLETICLKCLRKEPAGRYASAEALAFDLEMYLTGQPIKARPVGAPERVFKWIKRRPTAAALVLVSVLAVGLLAAGWTWSKGQIDARRMTGLVEMLENTEINLVPKVIHDLDGLRPRVNRLLERRLRETPRDSSQHLHLALALLPVDGSQAAYLRERLLKAVPAELAVIRDALMPRRETESPPLWTVLEDARADKSQRLRAAAVLAALDPDSPRWVRCRADVAAWLVSTNRFQLGEWVDLLRPARRHLRDPLAVLFRERDSTEEREAATFILADYLDDLAPLVDLIKTAELGQLAAVVSKLASFGASATHRLGEELTSALAAASGPDDPRTLTKRRANLALAFLLRKQEDRVWPLLKHGEDDGLRTALIHRFARAGVGAEVLTSRFASEPDASIRLALLLGLGEYPTGSLPPSGRDRFSLQLREVYRTDPDPGLHSAADWLLRRWDRAPEVEEIDKSLASAGPEGEKRWYVNRQGETFAVVRGPVVFSMGSPDSEIGRRADEPRHRRKIDRCFAIAVKETTVGQYRRRPENKRQGGEGNSQANEPVDTISYTAACMYCRQLSLQEGMTDENKQVCYPDYAVFMRGGMKPYPDYLSRPGYRLPTEAEWEYACRAGSTTARYFGQSEEHLKSYVQGGTSAGRGAAPVGMLKPNDLGLFDALGNLSEWCQDSYGPYPEETPGKPANDAGRVDGEDSRVYRGGFFVSRPAGLRSSARLREHPNQSSFAFGFRVARTLPDVRPPR